MRPWTRPRGGRRWAGECLNHRVERSGQRGQIVSTFGDQHDSSTAALLRHPTQLAGHGGESARRQPHPGERIALVRVEPGGDEQEIRLELTKHRENYFVEHDPVISVD